MTFNEELPVIYRLKLYALFINGENEAALYSMICYIEVSYIEVSYIEVSYRGILYRGIL